MSSATRATGVFRSSSKNRYGSWRFSNFMASAPAVSGLMDASSRLSGSRSALLRPVLVLGSALGRVVAGQDDIGPRRRGARRREPGRHRLHAVGLVVTRRWGRERGRPLDHGPVVLQP